jgi:hypothetical protein
MAEHRIISSSGISYRFGIIDVQSGGLFIAGGTVTIAKYKLATCIPAKSAGLAGVIKVPRILTAICINV